MEVKHGACKKYDFSILNFSKNRVVLGESNVWSTSRKSSKSRKRTKDLMLMLGVNETID